MSSWLRRLANANFLAPAELYRATVPGSSPRPQDLDRRASDILIARLSEHTGMPSSGIALSTFRRWAGLLFDDDDGVRKLPWLPHSGTDDSRRAYGQQVCIACLREHEVPYLRLAWRLGFVTACPVHHLILIDRCPACGAPVQINQSAFERFGLLCWNCHVDLTLGDTEIADQCALTAQLELLRILERGWVRLVPDRVEYSISFFAAFLQLLRLVATGRHALAMRKELGGTVREDGIPRTRYIELLDPRSRHYLIPMAWALCREWPHSFVGACQAVGLSARWLAKEPRTLPFFYWDAVTRHLSYPSREVGKDEIDSAKAYLQSNGLRPTYNALIGLFGVKLNTERAAPEPAAAHIPYGSGRYWKLDGVSAEVRRAAMLAAHRAGENVGPWVDQQLRRLLTDVCGANATAAMSGDDRSASDPN